MLTRRVPSYGLLWSQRIWGLDSHLPGSLLILSPRVGLWLPQFRGSCTNKGKLPLVRVAHRVLNNANQSEGVHDTSRRSSSEEYRCRGHVKISFHLMVEGIILWPLSVALSSLGVISIPLVEQEQVLVRVPK